MNPNMNSLEFKILMGLLFSLRQLPPDRRASVAADLVRLTTEPGLAWRFAIHGTLDAPTPPPPLDEDFAVRQVLERLAMNPEVS